jgi:amidohydrolase
MIRFFLAGLLLLSVTAFSQEANIPSPLSSSSDRLDKIESKVIAWRRDFHEHPELGNHEVRTAEVIARHLRSLGMEVKTGIAKTGVVGILRGGKPGAVVALRADMDALPVKERVDLPFASKATAQFNGQEVNVMHACGHDSHMAILMGVAELLAAQKKDLKGTVKFVFQPAEEGAPFGEQGGAELMVKEGILQDPKVDAIFGLHIDALTEVGKINYRPGGSMASVNDMRIIVKGRQAHGASPWSSVDPIVVSAQIINNLQAIVSRNLNITENAGVVTIGSIHAGNRSNIIPEQAEMMGTLRALSTDDEKMMIERVKQVATKTAESAGATAEVIIPFSAHYPVTFNNEALTAQMLPVLQKTAGANNVVISAARTGAEDFSFYQEKVPGLFIFLGGMPKGKDPQKTASHHTPDFFIDESGFKLGVKAMADLAVGYLEMSTK